MDCSDSSCENVCTAKRSPKCVKQFDKIEDAGADITSRCVGCRNWQKCKQSERLDCVVCVSCVWRVSCRVVPCRVVSCRVVSLVNPIFYQMAITPAYSNEMNNYLAKRACPLCSDVDHLPINVVYEC